MTDKTKLPRRFRNLEATLPLFLCLVLALQGAARSQTIPGQSTPSPAQVEWEAQQKRAAEKAENEKRQQAIKKDTDRLLELATELKQYVDKTNEHTLSVDVIKKAEEIEKLAHTVREKMKGQ